MCQGKLKSYRKREMLTGSIFCRGLQSPMCVISGLCWFGLINWFDCIKFLTAIKTFRGYLVRYRICQFECLLKPSSETRRRAHKNSDLKFEFLTSCFPTLVTWLSKSVHHNTVKNESRRCLTIVSVSSSPITAQSIWSEIWLKRNLKNFPR